MAEEIDFAGIITYICGNFMNDVRKRIFGTKEEGCIAERDIISKTIEYSASKTKGAKEKTVKFVEGAIAILYNLTPMLEKRYIENDYTRKNIK